MAALGLECIVRAPDVEPKVDPYGSAEEFLAAKLTGEPTVPDES
jgi:hypothetical protein